MSRRRQTASEGRLIAMYRREVGAQAAKVDESAVLLQPLDKRRLVRSDALN